MHSSPGVHKVRSLRPLTTNSLDLQMIFDVQAESIAAARLRRPIGVGQEKTTSYLPRHRVLLYVKST